MDHNLARDALPVYHAAGDESTGYAAFGPDVLPGLAWHGDRCSGDHLAFAR